MTVVIRILGCVWLGVAIAAATVIYAALLALDGAIAVASTFTGSGILGLVGLLSMSLPGVLLLALATWLDWRRSRR